MSAKSKDERMIGRMVKKGITPGGFMPSKMPPRAGSSLEVRQRAMALLEGRGFINEPTMTRDGIFGARKRKT